MGADQYSLEECKRLAGEGDAEARWQLGRRYETGDGLQENGIRAVAQYRKAAEAGHREACARLAEMYRKGESVPKDPVMAARYGAMAKGEDVKRAEQEAKAKKGRSNTDEIELALDYLLGRSGKARDVKAGIRMLYTAARDNPAAQRVFVRRWCTGDLNKGIRTIEVKEWEFVVPWFKKEFEGGNFEAGYIVGLYEFQRGNYRAAISYWEKTEDMRAWLIMARIFDPYHPNDWGNESGGGGQYGEGGADPTEELKSHTKAINAYRRYLKYDPDNMDGWRGLIFAMLGRKGASGGDYKFVREKTEGFLKARSTEGWILYANATSALSYRLFAKEYCVTQCLEEYRRHLRTTTGDYERRTGANKAMRRLEAAILWEKKYLKRLQQALEMGFEPAAKWMKSYEREISNREYLWNRVKELERGTMFTGEKLFGGR